MIYRHKCDRVKWDEYIGESARTFGVRLKENVGASLLSMTIPMPQDILSVWTTLVLWVKNHTTSPELSRGLYL